MIEIIFDLSEEAPFSTSINNKTHFTEKCFINGFNTSNIQMPARKNHHFLGIQLYPSVIKKQLNTPAGIFSNSLTDLQYLDSSLLSLWYKMKNESSFNKRLGHINSWLKKTRYEIDSRDQMINNFILSDNLSFYSVKKLAAELCYSTRQLSRKMLELTGMNAEDILLYKRYLHSIQLMHSCKEYSLTDIAYRSGFSDQSHYIRTFKSFTSFTPGEYRTRMSRVRGHIYQDVR